MALGNAFLTEGERGAIGTDVEPIVCLHRRCPVGGQNSKSEFIKMYGHPEADVFGYLMNKTNCPLGMIFI